MQEISKKSEELPEPEKKSETKTPEKPPLRLVPRLEQESKKPEIYKHWREALENGLFKPGVVFEVKTFDPATRWHVFVVTEFEPGPEDNPQQVRITLKKLDHQTHKFENEAKEFRQTYQYGDFEKLGTIDIKEKNWDKQEYCPPVQQKTSGPETNTK